MTETGRKVLQILAADEQLLADLRAGSADARAMTARERMAFLIERLRPLAEKHRLSLTVDDLLGPIPDDALSLVTGGADVWDAQSACANSGGWDEPILDLLFGARR